MPRLTAVFCSLLLALIALPASAQPSFGDAFNAPAAARPSGNDQAPPVTARIELSRSTLAPGQDFLIALVIEHAEHYHTNLHEPVVPDAMKDDFYPVATTLELPETDALSFGAVQWPKPSVVGVDFMMTGDPIEYQVYSGQAVIYIPVHINDAALLGTMDLELPLRFQACDDTICLPPQTEKLKASIEIVASADASAPLPPVFADYDPAQAAVPTPPSTQSSPSAAPSAATFFGIPLPGGGIVGLIALALLGAAGGLILNLTPCVLPVIPIKVMTLSRHAGEDRSRAVMLGFWMAFGVIAFWAALAIPVLALQGFTDPSRIFGIWWLTTLIGVLIALMSLGLMGMFQITLPQKLYRVNPRADSPWGSFVFGIMTAVLGLPCFGFVAGALVPAAITQGTAFVIILFVSMGVGMALPYLVLSIFPKMVNKLPRTGPASELVKQIMGLLLLAAAAYFIGSGLIALVASKPYLARLLHIWIAAIFALAAGSWLMIKTIQISRKPANRAVFGFIALLIAASGILVANRFTRDARQEYTLRQAALAQSAAQRTLLTTTWNDFSPQLMQRALDEGFVVIQDFTAEWCINCKVLEKTVLGSAAVKAQFAMDDTVMFKVDLTGANPEGNRALRDLGRTGIPTLAIYGPGLDAPWVSSAYTPEQVVEAITRARGPAAVTFTTSR